MAVVHAGVKRPYDQVRDIARSISASRSREVTPVPLESHESGVLKTSHSGVNTPSSRWREVQRRATFDHDASVVLIGVRGVGKSSLAILAATAYSRRLIDTEKAFLDATGYTSQAYRKAHGADAFHRKHRHVLSHTLRTHDKNSVVVCSFSDLEHQGSSVLAEYAESHAVIHITRDAAGIQRHLQVWTVERVQQLLLATGPLLRSCANFEFFNLTEKLAETASQDAQDLAKSGSLFLTLKRVERDFLKLIGNILGDHKRVPSHHSAYPLSRVPVHDRTLTLAAQASVRDIVDSRVDIDDLQIGADVVELIIGSSAILSGSRDTHTETTFLEIAEAFAILRRHTIVPIITTVAQDTSADWEHYYSLVSYCLRLGPEYCTVDLKLDDLRIALLVRSKGRTMIAGWLHYEECPLNGWQSDACMDAYTRGDRLQCATVRITMPAKRIENNFAVHDFRRRAESMELPTQLSAYNTGKEGRMSVCFNKHLTPVKPLGAAVTDIDDGSPLLTSRDVFTALFAAFVYEPLHFFIYGANVSYSLSPAMHNAAYRACGMPHTYGIHSSDTLVDLERLSHQPNFGGAAVVQPYKTGVLPLLKGLSPHAAVIGSVNTVMPIREMGENGSVPDQLHMLRQANRSGPVKALFGENSDWVGVRACLRRGLSPANTVRPQSTALVCGAGGQARSAIYAALSLGVRTVFICNRTTSNARKVADHYNKLIDSCGISILSAEDAVLTQVRLLESFSDPWPKEYRQPSMIVSSIPTQAADGTPTNFTLPDAWLGSPTGGIVIELAYRPMLTPIVAQMRAQAHKGWILMDGFDVLPEQAFAQFELFTGRRAPRKLMRDEVLKKYREEQEHLEEARSLDPNPPAT